MINLQQKSNLINFAFGCLAIFAVVLFFYGKSGNNDTKNITTYFANFVKAEGIKQGDKIYLAGVEVGKVLNLSLKENSNVLVKFELNSNIRVTEDSMLFIKSIGLDSTFIGIITGIDSYILKENETIYNTSYAISLNETLDLVAKTIAMSKQKENEQKEINESL